MTRLARICTGLFLATVLLAPAALPAEIKLIPLITGREEYNSNILFDPNDSGTLTDIITTISPGLRITDRTERLDSTLQSLVNVIRYRDNDEFDATDQNHSAQVSYRFTERWQGSADAAYVKDSRVDRDIETTGQILGTYTRRRTHGGGSTGYALTEKAGVNLAYSYDRDNFDSPSAVDSTSQNASLGFTYDLSAWLPQTVAQAQTTYAFYDYTDTKVIDVAATVGAKTQLSEKLALTAYLGRSRTRTNTTYFEGTFFEFDDRSITRGNVGTVVLSYAGEKTSGNVSLYQGVKALSGDQNAVRRTSLQAGVSQRFTEDVTGAVTGEYYLNKANQGELASENIDEQTWWVQPRLSWRLTTDFLLETSYRYTRLKDKETDLEYEQNMAFLRLVWQYPMPR
jgi:hypothetical protein